jgi:2-keto-4-pentenoate hydratase/2-oxohepta-3-ene-1,7-dioic acid hydratase in catechol pathway
MRLGRAVVGDSTAFVIGREDGAWYSLDDLGITAVETLGSAKVRAVTPTRWLSPVVRPSKVFGIGLNYMDHIRETGAEAPGAPVVFAKFPNSLSGPSDPIELHGSISSGVDYEAELAVIIGTRARDLDHDDALEAVFGYCVANDVSARDIQRAESQFSRSKSFDTFCPIGPWITTAESVPDPQALQVRSIVNGDVRQDASTSEMIFDVRDLLVRLSAGLTLEPGDVILTGTPHGVGFVMDPPRFLAPGDVVRCEIEGLGAIENPCVASTTGASA